MHKFLRAIGFNQFKTDEDVDKFLFEEVINEKNIVFSSALEGGSVLTEYRLKAAENMGVCAVTERFRSGRTQIFAYYPYVYNSEISSEELCSLERYTEKESYAGLIDEFRIGISLIFYVNNFCSYLKLPEAGKINSFRGTWLSALSNSGTIILPIASDKDDINVINKKKEEDKLIEKAKNGDEDAIETLTVADMDTYSQISKRIETEDLYSIVESSFIPCGVECDQYSILGEIVDVKETVNSYTDEKIYKLRIVSNEVKFLLVIREADLLGVPEKGRRFKGRIWMQGRVDFTRPEGGATA